MSEYKALVYLPLKPEIAKKLNLPLKLPVRIEDLPIITDKDRIPLDVILRGLETQCEIKDESYEYYLSYLIFFYYEKVKKLISAGDYERALEMVEKAGEHAKDYRYHFYRGVVLKKMGRIGEAEVELKISHSENPNFALAHYELGNLYIEEGDLEEARKSFEIARKLDSSFSLPLVKLGDVELKAGNFEKAIEMYESALRIDPNLPDVYNRLGVINNDLQRFEKARILFEKALQIHPDYTDAMYNLAYTYVKLGKLFEALKILRELEKKVPDDPHILNELGIVMREVGLFEESIERLQRAYEISKEPWIGYNYVRSLTMVDLEEALHVADTLEDDEFRIKSLELVEHSKNEVIEIKIFEDWEEIIEECDRELICVLSEVESERISEIMETGIAMEDTDEDTTELLDLAISYFLSSKNFAEMERRSIEIGVALYGSSVMLGVLRTLLRMFQMKILEGYVEAQHVIDVVVPELQDLNWDLALKVSRSLEKPPIIEPKRGSDFVVALLSNLHSSSETAKGLVKTLTDILSRGDEK